MEVMATTPALTELQKQASELMKDIKCVDEDIKKATGIDYESHRANMSQRNFRRRIKVPDMTVERIPDDDKNSGNFISSEAASTTSNTDESSLSKKRLISVDGLPEGEHKKARLYSTIVVAPEQQSGHSLFSQAPPPEAEKPSIFLDQETINRSKRMFGFLKGTLSKFKAESEQNKEQLTKRLEFEEKIKVQSVKEQEEARVTRMALFRDRREKQQKLKVIEEQLEAADLQQKLVLHYELLKKYIKLDSCPQIFYKPAKHNNNTRLKHERCSKMLEENLFEVVKEIMSRSAKNLEEFEANTNELSIELGNDESKATSTEESSSRKRKMNRLCDGIDLDDESSTMLAVGPDDEDKAAAEDMLRNAASEYDQDREVIEEASQLTNN